MANNSDSSHAGISHHATTVVGVHRDGVTALAADGQVTLGERHVTKGSARKLHRLEGSNVIAGIAGSVGDALLLLEAFESQTSVYPDDLNRAAIEFVRQWRTDRFPAQIAGAVGGRRPHASATGFGRGRRDCSR